MKRKKIDWYKKVMAVGFSFDLHPDTYKGGKRKYYKDLKKSYRKRKQYKSGLFGKLFTTPNFFK